MLHCMMETIHRYAMVQPGDTVTVALSGGADSTALLLGLLALREQLGISLRAVHVNHHLRGTESDRDAAFCAQLCEERQVPFFLGTCDVATYAAQRKHTSCEMAARELRYAQLEALCPPGSKIATAHTASDNTETVLERLTRGTGLAGLCGRPGQDHPTVAVCHPTTDPGVFGTAASKLCDGQYQCPGRIFPEPAAASCATGAAAAESGSGSDGGRHDPDSVG